MMRFVRAFLGTAALSLLAAGCGPGGGEAGAPEKGQPVFKPRPGEAARKEMVMELLQKKGMLPAKPGSTNTKK